MILIKEMILDLMLLLVSFLDKEMEKSVLGENRCIKQIIFFN